MSNVSFELRYQLCDVGIFLQVDPPGAADWRNCSIIADAVDLLDATQAAAQDIIFVNDDADFKADGGQCTFKKAPLLLHQYVLHGQGAPEELALSKTGMDNTARAACAAAQQGL